MAAEEKTKKESEKTENNKQQERTKKRRRLPYPNIPFEDSLLIANAIWKFASGQKIRRITLFDNLDKSPDSGPSRAMITNSSKYGLTTGSYQADYLELTPEGAVATNPDETSENKFDAIFKLAINNNDYFSKLYDNFKDMKLPSQSVMEDYLEEIGLPKEECAECVEIFILNCKFIGAIKVCAGSERILTYEHMLENIQKDNNDEENKSFNNSSLNMPTVNTGLQNSLAAEQTNSKWDNICFYITPIGEEDSEERKHADLFLNQIVEPVVNTFGFKVIRADKINAAGLITSQIIEHIIKSKLVIADLSFHNPNVFYELSLRHSKNLPTVHIIRKADKIPFDLNSFRTVIIDTSSIYTLVPQLETYKTQLSSYIRQLIDNPDSVENPITAYLNSKNKQR